MDKLMMFCEQTNYQIAYVIWVFYHKFCGFGCSITSNFLSTYSSDFNFCPASINPGIIEKEIFEDDILDR